MTTSLTRRQALGIGAGATIALTTAGPVAAASASSEHTWKQARSANGWHVIDSTTTYRVEGTNVEVSLARGDVATVLLYVARRFAYEVDMLRAGDLHGHTIDRTVGALFESNHLSGTAIAIRPMHYPLGADVNSTGMSGTERIVVADVLAECEGVVTWGGDLKPVKQSHFHIDVKPGDPRLKRLAARIRERSDAPGEGAGSIDAFTPARRRLAARSQ
ncbi:M15 family metallopeptidase [Streptomyces sp. B21-105]|uniref:M15 family metallopeptidase n=1 Tax=Streptomyces sp. B21-105 TaxID=3039417 RepID=UPI002FF0F2BF